MSFDGSHVSDSKEANLYNDHYSNEEEKNIKEDTPKETKDPACPVV